MSNRALRRLSAAVLGFAGLFGGVYSFYGPGFTPIPLWPDKLFYAIGFIAMGLGLSTVGQRE